MSCVSGSTMIEIAYVVNSHCVRLQNAALIFVESVVYF